MLPIYYLYRCWRWDGSRRSDSDGRAVLQAEERDGEVEGIIFFLKNKIPQLCAGGGGGGS